MARFRYDPARFLRGADEEAVVAAIARAEAGSTAELVVQVDRHARVPGQPVASAERAFGELGLHRTAQRNAVLFYIALLDHQLAIVGDEGIDRAVQRDFWDERVRELLEAFAAGRPAEGLVAAIDRCGDELARHFPAPLGGSGNPNELPDRPGRG